MVQGLKPMGKLVTYGQTQVSSKTKALHGPRTQAYVEINYIEEILSVYLKKFYLALRKRKMHQSIHALSL